MPPERRAAALRRVLRYIESSYPSLVKAGRLNRFDAQEGIEAMRDVVKGADKRQTVAAVRKMLSDV